MRPELTMLKVIGILLGITFISMGIHELYMAYVYKRRKW